MSSPGSLTTTAGRSQRFHILLLVVLQIAAGLVRLDAVPRVYNDDAWEAALGHSLAFDGTLRHPIIEGWGGMHIHFVQDQVVQPLLLAALYRIAGFSLWISRFASVLMGTLAAVCAYGVVRRWLTPRFALCVGLATIVHPWFFEISRRVRPDIYAVAFALLALWLFTYPMTVYAGLLTAKAGLCGTGVSPVLHRRDTGATQLRWFSSFLAGLTAGVAVLSHPTGGVLTSAFLAGVILWDRPSQSARRLLLVVLGATVAVLPYAIYVIWASRHPEVSFWDQMHGGKPMVITGVRDILTGEWQRWRHFTQWPKGAPLAALMLLAWLAGWYRSSRGDKAMCTAIGLFALAMPFTTVNYTSRYLVGLVPFFAALLARLGLRLACGRVERPAWPAERWAAGGMGLLYFALCLGAVGLMFQRLQSADVRRVFDRVASVTGPQAKVYGEIMFWLGGDRYAYGPFPLDAAWRTPIEEVAQHGFDYAIRGAWNFTASEGISVPPLMMPDWRSGYAIDTICREYGVKVSEFRDPYFGPIEIYRLHWPALAGP